MVISKYALCRLQNYSIAGLAMWATVDKIRELIKDNEFFSDVDLYFDDIVEKWRLAK